MTVLRLMADELRPGDAVLLGSARGGTRRRILAGPPVAAGAYLLWPLPNGGEWQVRADQGPLTVLRE